MNDKKCPVCGSTEYEIGPNARFVADESAQPSPLNIYIGYCKRCGHSEEYHLGPVLKGWPSRAELEFLPRGKKDMYGIGLPAPAEDGDK